MAWLWSVGPLVILATALWLAVGTRRLVQQRQGLAEDRHSALADRTIHLRSRASHLHRSVASFDDRRGGDTDADGVDR